jgi:hypothetical protein
MFLQLRIYVIFVVRVGFNTVDVSDTRGIKTVKLIAWSWAQFENNTTGSLDE